MSASTVASTDGTPTGSQIVDRDLCEHVWRHLETCRWTDYGGYNTTFHRVDRFFCEKCLEMKDKAKSGTQRETPDWYKNNE